jgi:hypothetical protein
MSRRPRRAGRTVGEKALRGPSAHYCANNAAHASFQGRGCHTLKETRRGTKAGNLSKYSCPGAIGSCSYCCAECRNCGGRQGIRRVSGYEVKKKRPLRPRNKGKPSEQRHMSNAGTRKRGRSHSSSACQIQQRAGFKGLSPISTHCSATRRPPVSRGQIPVPGSVAITNVLGATDLNGNTNTRDGAAKVLPNRPDIAVRTSGAYTGRATATLAPHASVCTRDLRFANGSVSSIYSLYSL